VVADAGGAAACKPAWSRRAVLAGLVATVAVPAAVAQPASPGAARAPDAPSAAAGAAPSLYAKAYGRAADPAVVFLHGGPGYNAYLFEATAAEALAQRGFRVIVFDQRGCGRSTSGTDPAYDFTEAVADLDGVLARFEVRRAVLLGQGFGGTLGLVYAEQRSERVAALGWIGTPLSYPAMFRTVMAAAREVYAQQDPAQLRFLDMLEQADRGAYDYAYYTQQHAVAVGLLRPAQPTEAARRLYQAAAAGLDGSLLQQSRRDPLRGFLATTRYTTLDFGERALDVAARVPLLALYGAEDRQFDDRHLDRIRRTAGDARFVRVPAAAHNVYADNRPAFLDAMVRLARRA
jgi:proline iminopeptidase